MADGIFSDGGWGGVMVMIDVKIYGGSDCVGNGRLEMMSFGNMRCGRR